MPENASKNKNNYSENEEVVSVRGLHKSFGKNHVLRGIDFKLFKGENLIVLGRSGSGKSVLIKCLVHLVEADKGEINVLGKKILALEQEDLDHIRAKVGFLFQSSALYDSLTVKENLEFPLRRHKKNMGEKQVNNLVIEALENVGLKKALNLMPAELSGGMRKRIALARTLILKPEIILYDEPTTGLDPITAREISHLMLEIQEKYNTSSIIITHDMPCVRALDGRILMLDGGRFKAEGTYKELRNSDDPEVHLFFE